MLTRKLGKCDSSVAYVHTGRTGSCLPWVGQATVQLCAVIHIYSPDRERCTLCRWSILQGSQAEADLPKCLKFPGMLGPVHVSAPTRGSSKGICSLPTHSTALRLCASGQPTPYTTAQHCCAQFSSHTKKKKKRLPCHN